MLILMSWQSPSVHTKVRLSFEEVWTCKKPVCHHSQQQISKAGPSFVPAKFVALKHYPLKDPWLQNLALDWIHPHQKHMFKRRCLTYPTALKILKIRCFVCFPLLATGFNIASSKTIQMWQSTWQRVDRIRLHNCSEPHQLNSWGPAGTLIASLSDAGEKKKPLQTVKDWIRSFIQLSNEPSWQAARFGGL